MRKEFELDKEDFDFLIDACKPVPYMIFGGHEPASPQENANRAWQHLGSKLGFVWDTVLPVQGKSQNFFTAEEKLTCKEITEMVDREG